MGACAVAGCGSVDRGGDLPTVAFDAAPTASDAADAASNTLPIDPGCTAPSGVSTQPHTIEDAVTLINALKAQQTGVLTLPCFLQSLARPFGALATKSVFSAQPATGSKNPRFFIFEDGLVMSVVSAGTGRPLLELAGYTSEVRSIKAEVHFPVEAPLSDDAPYQRILYGTGTVCGACHASENPVGRDGGGGVDHFESDVLRPRASENVSLASLRTEYENCVPEVDPERCAMLSALFGHGEMTAGAFSPNAHTIYSNGQ